ncbi:ras-related protein Rab-39B-like [Dysidea avara]|uniref:ras-related protein Rab-39B-like n=1 Tax=Dysidea avara TaxID=196820 RepID=UPI003322BF70
MASLPDVPYVYQFRLIIIGDSTVGKSSLLRQFTEGKYLEFSDPTVGVDFHAKIVKVDGDSPVKLQLWDTAGQERFRAITRSYYRNAVGGLLVYDITNKQSFENLTSWLSDASQSAEPHKLVFILVGHKADQDKNREVTKQEAMAFAADHDMNYIETSAKAMINIDQAFVLLAENIYNKVQTGAIKIQDGWDGVKRGTTKRGHRNNGVYEGGPRFIPSAGQKKGCCD